MSQPEMDIGTYKRMYAMTQDHMFKLIRHGNVKVKLSADTNT